MLMAPFDEALPPWKCDTASRLSRSLAPVRFCHPKPPGPWLKTIPPLSDVSHPTSSRTPMQQTDPHLSLIPAAPAASAISVRLSFPNAFAHFGAKSNHPLALPMNRLFFVLCFFAIALVARSAEPAAGEGWSETVRGLRARMVFGEELIFAGTQVPEVYLELHTPPTWVTRWSSSSTAGNR